MPLALFTRSPIVKRLPSSMIRILLAACTVPAVLGIIVTDPPPLAPEYKYSYNIEDPTTGDTKSQHEVRQGNVVTGQYSVLEPDGTKRIVDYTAHPSKGFQAVVHTEPAVDVQPMNAPVNNYVIPIEQLARSYQYAPVHQNTLYTSVAAAVETPVYKYAPAPPYHSKSNYAPQSVYFTPANEINSDNDALQNGQYFAPAH